MRCPSCLAITQQNSVNCSECGAIQGKQSVELSGQVRLPQADTVEESAPTDNSPARPVRSLIEFPGVTINAVPQWRKELGERVREVQERKAREALLEAGGVDSLLSDDESRIPLLELLPRAEVAPVNPIVAAALQRIERAHTQPRFSGNAALANVLAYNEQTEFGLDASPSIEDSDGGFSMEERQKTSTRVEKVHNLAVVPPPAIIQQATTESAPIETPDIEQAEVSKPIRKPKRLIGDLNDPALNYLDSIPVAIRVEVSERRSAPIIFRLFSAILDLAIICLLSSPVVALVKLTDLKWQDSRTLIFGFGTVIVIGFLYLTICTAFTGRTLGMRPFSIRVVDARTGLIPTGGQSAARSLVYLLSLASAGIALFYTFVDRERLAAHDRITRTTVVRV